MNYYSLEQKNVKYKSRVCGFYPLRPGPEKMEGPPPTPPSSLSSLKAGGTPTPSGGRVGKESRSCGPPFSTPEKKKGRYSPFLFYPVLGIAAARVRTHAPSIVILGGNAPKSPLYPKS